MKIIAESRVARLARFKKDRRFMSPAYLMGRLHAWAKNRLRETSPA